MAADPSRKNPIVYTPEDKAKIIDFWNKFTKENKGVPPDLVSIVKHYSDGNEVDPRSKIGRLVREVLSHAKIKAKTMQHVHVEEYILSDSDKEFIKNNIADNRIIDLARTLHSDKKIEPLGREVRTITKYLKEIGEYVVKKDEGTITEGEYFPPKTFHEILKKVNFYLHEELSTQNITAYEKKCLESTIQFMHSPRFGTEINNYKTIEKRITFESEFIRAVYSKPDINPEEIGLILNYCADVIEVSDSKKQAESLKQLLDQVTDDREGKIAMSLVEAIQTINTHISEVLKRQERIYALLNKSRAKRDEEKSNKTANLAQLFEWFRDEENRKKAVKQAELIRENRKTEVKREENLSDTILLCLGMSAESI